ncbi:MORN repeat-containing protein 3-like [Uranotaenia lowii]|uniref:MORN repeat-containing protein 3-like n=1 Tax=Uranotaenia lowii TaxID=190385 RepID=UPI00247A2CE2|nr:MORN repeat-containing protein 3-like [Uranotaenia lowii]
MKTKRLASFFTKKSHYRGEVDEKYRKCGLGVQKRTNGWTYEGQWKDGLRNGYGILYRKMADMELCEKIYVGDWKNNRKHGLGIKYFKDGKYLGFWSCGQRSGHGFMWFDNGDFYMGEWADDVYEGLGIMLYISGDRYHGEFHTGLKHGEGLYFHSRTGQLQRGHWCCGICKMGSIEDWNRNQVVYPTIYPLPEVKLGDFPEVFLAWMDKYAIHLHNGGQCKPEDITGFWSGSGLDAMLS